MRRRETNGTFSRIDLPIEIISRLYNSGLSELALAKQFFVSRGAIRQRLIETGTRIRGQSDAELLKWSKMSEQQRLYQVKAAHDAVRGTKYSREVGVKKALMRQQSPFLSPLEQQLLNVFTQCGIKVVPQFALEIYSIDFAIPEIKLAIEVDGGNWHDSPAKRSHDTGKEVLLSNRNWKLIRVRIDKGTLIIRTNIESIDHAKVLQTICSDPSLWRENSVVTSEPNIA